MESDAFPLGQFNTIQEVYTKLITDPVWLQNGEAILAKCLDQVPNFALESVALLLNTSVDPQTRVYVAALIRNTIKNNWFSIADSDNLKQSIREHLIEGLVQNHPWIKIIDSLSLIISDLMLMEGVDVWEPFIRELLGWFNSEEDAENEACLEAFCNFFGKTDNRMSIIIPHLMPYLFPLFSRSELSTKLREKVLILFYLCITTLSYADGTDNALVERCFNETYDLWMSFFLSALQTSPKSHIGIKRQILRILTVLFRDYPKYSRKSLGNFLPVIWKFLNQNLPLYIWTVVYDIPLDFIDENLNLLDPKILESDTSQLASRVAAQIGKGETKYTGFELDDEQEFDHDLEIIASQLIELVATLITKPILRDILQLGIYPLINSLSYYMLMTRHDEHLWLKDPNQFISNDEDEGNYRGIRQSGLKLISDIVDKYPNEALQALLIVVEKFLQNLEEDVALPYLKNVFDSMGTKGTNKTGFNLDQNILTELIKTSSFNVSTDSHKWKKREVGLMVLGSFSEDIIMFQARTNENFDLKSLIENIANDLQVEGSLAVLRGRAFWCLSKFGDVIAMKDKELFFPLMKLAIMSLGQKEAYPVRLSVCKSIAEFGYKIDKFKLLDQAANPDTIRNEFLLSRLENLDEIHEITLACSEETVHYPLEALLYIGKLNRVFSERIATLFGDMIVELYSKFATERIIGGCLKDIMKLLCENPQAFVHLFTKFTEVFNNVFRQVQEAIANDQMPKLLASPINDESGENRSYTDYICCVVDVINLFLKSASDLKCTDDGLIEYLPNVMRLIANCEEDSIQVRATLCVKNYILYKTSDVEKRNHLKDINDIIAHLLKPTTLEGLALYSGNLVMITSQYLLNGNNDINHLKAVINKVYKVKMPSIIQSLVLVYARLINQNAKETLNFLTSFSVENRPALKVLIDKWLLQQPLFKGKITKNVTYLALMRLFMLKDKRLETLLVIGYNPSHANIGSEVNAPLKIMSLLIRALDNELKFANKGEEENGKMGNGRMKDFDGEMDEDAEWQEEDDGWDELYGGGEDDNKIQVDIGVIKDDDEQKMDMDKRFNTGLERKDRGLADVETGSACYMSEMLDFNDDGNDECDENTEEDLITLKDPSGNMNLVEILKSFFTELMSNDADYFRECVKNLLTDDVKLIKKIFKVDL